MINSSLLSSIVSPYATKIIPEIVENCNKQFPSSRYQINTKLRVCAFLAQAAEETGGFRYLEEIGDVDYFKRYDGRDGNNEPGDGYKYKGRGIFDLTFKDNYALYGKLLNLDLLNHPEIAALVPNAVLIACEYWKQHDLNYYADEGNFIEITRRINGAENGLQMRECYYKKLLNAYAV